MLPIDYIVTLPSGGGADLELEEDFFCGSVGSAMSTLPPESMSNNNNLIPRSSIVQANWDQAQIPFVEDSHLASNMADLVNSQRWHDYLDMSKKYTTNNSTHRSEPISITDKH